MCSLCSHSCDHWCARSQRFRSGFIACSLCIGHSIDCRFRMQYVCACIPCSSPRYAGYKAVPPMHLIRSIRRSSRSSDGSLGERRREDRSGSKEEGGRARDGGREELKNLSAGERISRSRRQDGECTRVGTGGRILTSSLWSHTRDTQAAGSVLHCFYLYSDQGIYAENSIAMSGSRLQSFFFSLLLIPDLFHCDYSRSLSLSLSLPPPSTSHRVIDDPFLSSP